MTWLVAASLCSTPAWARAPETADPSPAQSRVPVLVDVHGLKRDRVVEELELRLARREVVSTHAERPDGAMLYALVERQPDGVVRLTLVRPGGDAFDRSIEDSPGQSERIAASALANLIDSVEAGEVAPDRKNVPIPPAAAPPVAAARPAPEPETAPDEPSPFEVGLVVAPQTSFGLAPASAAPAWAGIGAGLGVDIRWRRGGTVAAELRAIGRNARDLGLARLRIAGGGGWTWRVGPIEVPLVASLFVEPWFLTRDGRRAPLSYGGSEQVRVPLLGGALRLAPGMFVRTRSERLTAVRLGIRVAAAGGFVPHERPRSVEIAIERPSGPLPVLRLGGLELDAGLEVALWFAP